MIVNPGVVDVHTSLKKWKHPEKRNKTTTYWKPQELLISKC